MIIEIFHIVNASDQSTTGTLNNNQYPVGNDGMDLTIIKNPSKRKEVPRNTHLAMQ